jgi:predicted protein tyrosine phosphatase
MTILVCPLAKVPEMIEDHAPERIVSLLDPDFTFPDAGPAYVGRHLRLHLHDAHIPKVGQVLATASHVEELLAFVARWERLAPILIHCRAGVGRSTATAVITACLHNPLADEREIVLALRRAAPLARPNEVLIQLADIALGRNGRMLEAVVETGRGLPWLKVHEGVPFEMPSHFPESPSRSDSDDTPI